jgi:hypothetical protein
MYKAKFIFLDTRLFHASVSGGKIGAFSSSGAYWAPALSIGTSKSFVNISTAFFKNDQENSKGVVATTLGYSKRLNHQLTLMNEGVMVFEEGDAILTMLGSSLKISRARYALSWDLTSSLIQMTIGIELPSMVRPDLVFIFCLINLMLKKSVIL